MSHCFAVIYKLEIGFICFFHQLTLVVKVTAEYLGKVYALLAARRARVIGEELKQGTPLFAIKALVRLDVPSLSNHIHSVV